MLVTSHMTKNIGADNTKQPISPTQWQRWFGCNGEPTGGVVQGAYHASFTSGGGGADCPLQNEYESVLEEVEKFEETGRGEDHVF